MFGELATHLSASAQLLARLFAEPHRTDYDVTAIKDKEHEADNLTPDVIERINTSLVTPFDREDIHLLASSLDNVIDLLDGTARRAAMFHIKEARGYSVRLRPSSGRRSSTSWRRSRSEPRLPDP